MDISLILRAIAEGKASTLELAKKIGEGYTELARTTPEFFERGLEPARSIKDVQAKYGLDLAPHVDHIPWYPDPEGPAKSPGVRVEVVPKRSGASEDLEERAWIDVEPGWYVNKYRGWIEGQPREFGEKLRGKDPWGMIYAGDFREGSGSGKKSYAALLDIANSMGAKVYPDVLSSVNQFRSTLQEIPSHLRHYPETFIYSSEKQIPRNMRLSPLELMELSPEMQTGVRLMAAAKKGGDYFQTGPRNLARMLANLKQPEMLQGIESTGLDPGVGYWGPLTAESPLAAYKNYAGSLRNANLKAFGPSFLRKLAVMEHLAAGRPITEINPELLKGLEYRHGGRV